MFRGNVSRKLQRGTTVALEVGGYSVIEDKREEVSI
jgi:hypothetical protein